VEDALKKLSQFYKTYETTTSTLSTRDILLEKGLQKIAERKAQEKAGEFIHVAPHKILVDST